MGGVWDVRGVRVLGGVECSVRDCECWVVGDSDERYDERYVVCFMCFL